MDLNRKSLRQIVALEASLPQIDLSPLPDVLRGIADAAGARPRRLRRDVITDLVLDGVLPPVHRAAAREIETIFAAITAGANGRTACYEPERAAAAAPDLPPSLRDGYLMRYTPWRAWAGSQGIAGSATLADLTLHVIIDNLGMRQVEQRYRLRNGSAARLLALSLDRYFAPRITS